jgi:hypothetical protein
LRFSQEGTKPQNPKQFKNANFSKTHQTHLGPREKLLGRAGFHTEVSSSKPENDFKTGFLGAKVWHFAQEGSGP